MMTDVTAPAAIGRLRIERRLGAGGFATVWLAHDPELDSPVAVKILAENFAAHADIRRRFVDEARLLRRVDSDHLVRVYDVGELRDGRPFFVMTFADRGSLAERMAQVPPPWPARSVVTVVDAVADGLTVLHRHGVVHRDLKPVNVLLRSDPDGTERVLLGDLGIAKDLQWASGLTMPAGSSGYAAPEQELYSEQIGPATDVHALAVTAGQLLDLQPPWPATPVGAVLTRATDPDPDRRTSSATTFAAELRESLEPSLSAAPTELIPPFASGGTTAVARQRRRRLIPLTVGAVVLAAGIGTVVGWNVLHGPQRIASGDGHVSIEVPRDLTRREDAAFPGRGDPRAGKRASADQRSVTIAYDPVNRDAGQVLTDVRPPGCTKSDSRTGRVGSWPGLSDRYTCPDGVTVDQVALTGGGPHPFTVWVEVKSVSGNPDLTSTLSSIDISDVG